MWRRAGRFFGTPKGIVTLVLAGLMAIAAPGQGGHRALELSILSATVSAGLLDLVIRRWKFGVWEYPSGAVLTAAIVIMVLRAQEPWYVATVASVIGVLSKYLVRIGRANVFNPAALALVFSFYLFHAGQSWWGAGTDVEGLGMPLLMATGILVANRVNKMPLVLVFLGTYFGLFALTAFVSEPLNVAEIFRTPDVQAALYFAFIILTDPPTSPAMYRDQVMCGGLVAAVSYACFETTGVVYYLLAGVLVGNVWEAWRRARRSEERTRRRPTPALVRS